MSAFVGCLEADLQGASEYQSGGVGPLFRETRREAPFSLLEFLKRTLDALRKAGLTSAVTLFIDELEIYTAGEESDNNLDEVLAAAQDAVAEDEGVSFYLSLTHEHDAMAHAIIVEASVDHPADEAAITVLDVATPLDEDGWVEADEDDPGEPLQPVGDDVTFVEEDEWDGEALVESFLLRLLDELDKALALDEPELETWIDWDNQHAGLGYGKAVPDTPGV